MSPRPVDVVLPPLGEGISEAFIAAWHKRVGDRVAPGDPLVDVITDKVTLELPAGVAGVVAELRFAEETRVHPGDVIAVIQPDA